MILVLSKADRNLQSAVYRMEMYQKHQQCSGRCGGMCEIFTEEAQNNGSLYVVGWCVDCWKKRSGETVTETREVIDSRNKVNGVICL